MSLAVKWRHPDDATGCCRVWILFEFQDLVRADHGHMRHCRFSMRFSTSHNQLGCCILNALKKVEGHDAVLDGEIVALKSDKHDFHALQLLKEKPAPLQYVVFDLLYLDGKDLRNEPLLERKKILKNFISEIGSKEIAYSDHILEDGRLNIFYD